VFDGEEYAHISKRRLSKAFMALVREISEAILEYDPDGIKDLVPKDEYDGEAMRLAARLRQATSEQDVKLIVLEVIGYAFGAEPDAGTAFLDIATKKIWQAWCSYLTPRKPGLT
jgi:hypothetical protein